ncbi:hypothetical protein K2P47_02715 [Patescibacteria group bacterium]|nr:hypothetical protein [Patescibacteria group bacterium]
MPMLFMFAMLLSLIAFVIGLVKPTAVKVKSKKKAGIVYGGLSVLFFILIGTTADPVIDTSRVEETTITEAQYIYDVPSLIGKNIDEVEVLIGEAERTYEPTELQEETGFISSEKTFVKNGEDLMISYNKDTREVIELFISSNDSSGANSDTDRLLQVGNLSQNESKYSVEFIPAMIDPSVYTGVLIKPN